MNSSRLVSLRTVSKRRKEKKRQKRPSLPAQMIQDRILLSYFLFLKEPVDLPSPVHLPHIQAVKEQIFIAQAQCNSLVSGNKYKRSTSRNNRVKKLRKRVRWLRSYFLDSVTETRPDGRKIRKITSTHPKKTPSITKPSPKRVKSLTTRKRRKFRSRKKIHRGPHYAPSGGPSPQGDTRSLIPNKRAETATQSNKSQNVDIASAQPHEAHPHNKHTMEAQLTEMDANGIDSTEGPEHVRDRIKGLLDRAIALAATDHDTDTHQKELETINREIELVKQHLEEVQSHANTSPDWSDQLQEDVLTKDQSRNACKTKPNPT